MGSLASRPSVPAPQPQVVFVPQTTTVADASTATENTSNDASDSQTESEVRQQSLLQRDRSRFGTVLTGFRGLLSLNENSGQRKTLLGE